MDSFASGATRMKGNLFNQLDSQELPTDYGFEDREKKLAS